MAEFNFKLRYPSPSLVLAVAVLLVALVFAGRVACMSQEAFACWLSDSYAFVIYKREVPLKAPEMEEKP